MNRDQQKPEPFSEYAEHYSEVGFWNKLRRFGGRLGKGTLEKALVLYFAMNKEDCPAWVKATILGALGYLIAPVDAIPDLAPILGLTDDVGVLSLALLTLATKIDENDRAQAEQKLKDWFGEELEKED